MAFIWTDLIHFIALIYLFFKILYSLFLIAKVGEWNDISTSLIFLCVRPLKAKVP